MKKILERKVLILGAVIVIVAGSAFAFIKTNGNGIEAYEIKRVDLEKQARFSGKVKPAESVDMGFDRAGRIAQITVAENDLVKEGDELARLENGSQVADVAEARSELLAQEAELEKLTNGSRPQEISQQESVVLSAQASASKNKNSLYLSIIDGYQTAQNAISKDADQFFSRTSTDPKLSLGTYSKSGIEEDRDEINEYLNKWKREQKNDFYSIDGDLDEQASRTITRVAFIRDFLSDLTNAVSDEDTNATTEQKNQIYTARQNVASALESLTDNQQSYEETKAKLKEESDKLDLLKEGTRSEDLLIQQAKVDKAMAELVDAQARLSQTLIKAPFDGIITKVNFEPRETVAQTEIIVEMISDKDFEVEGDVSELDIIGIEEGSKAEITLDAFGLLEIFPATVADIDRAETTIDNVPTYSTTLYFSESSLNEKLRSGMTANIKVISGKKESVLAVPLESLVTRTGNNAVVQVVESKNKITEREITIGFRGSNGLVEVVSGISEGEKVVRLPEEG